MALGICLDAGDINTPRQSANHRCADRAAGKMFLQYFSQEKKKRFVSITPEASAALKDYFWPGNIREPRNVIEWVTFMYDEKEVELWRLPMRTNGNKSAAARYLGVTRKTLGLHTGAKSTK